MALYTGAIDPRVLAEDFAVFNSANFSPDGKRIVYGRYGAPSFPWTRPRYHGSAATMPWLLDLEKNTRRPLATNEFQHLWTRFLPGGKEFLDELRSCAQVILLSDTFEQFASPLIRQLGWPTLLCHRLIVSDDRITGYLLRVTDQKRRAVAALVVAGIGGSFYHPAATAMIGSMPDRGTISSAAMPATM